MYKASNIMTCDDIAKSCELIQNTLEAQYPADNPAVVVDRAQAIEGYMALSGKMLADAKYHYNNILNGVFVQAVKEGNSLAMSPATMNKYISSLCKDYQYLVDWTDRINRACTHQLDLSRTLISKLKAEIQQMKYS